MNSRQAYALAHPITDPDDTRELAKVNAELTTTRRHHTGHIIMTILAVDR